MSRIIRRRTGKGYEREIQALTRLRTAILLDDRVDHITHAKVTGEIDILITSLLDLMRKGLNVPEKQKTGT